MNIEESMLIDAFKSTILVNNLGKKNHNNSDLIDYIMGDNFVEKILPNLSEYLSDSNLNLIVNLIYENAIFTQNTSLDDLVKCLCAYYLIDNNHEKKKIVMNVLTERNMDYIISLFKSSASFACELLKCFYHSYFVKKFRVLPSMVKNNKFNYYDRVEIINDKLRNTIMHYADSLVATGYGREDIYKILYGIIYNIVDVSELKSDDSNTISLYRTYIKRLMCADIYEDACMQDEDSLDSTSYNILYSVENKDYSLNYSIPEIFDVIDYFLDLLYNVPKRRNNRQRLYPENERVLRRINPLYKIERVSR